MGHDNDTATTPLLVRPWEHGSTELPNVRIDGYSLELHAGDTFVGDSVSRGAFSDMLDAWRSLLGSMQGEDPFASAATTHAIDKDRLDALQDQDNAAGAAVRAAVEDYAQQLAHVVRRFLRHRSWRAVERIVVGGGFQQTGLGRTAIQRAADLLHAAGTGVALCRLHHHPDEGGLVGWVHAAPPALLANHDGLLAVDIGGTNVRCGIVRPRLHRATDLSKADVIGRDKWGHADDADATRREHMVEGIAEMLEQLLKKAAKQKLSLAPFVGVACPGTIAADGAITGGTQNLPGNWESTRFHLPAELCRRLAAIDGQHWQVGLHNDAVVQGLSQLPWMQDVERWAVLTVGTGLGNASYTNRR